MSTYGPNSGGFIPSPSPRPTPRPIDVPRPPASVLLQLADPGLEQTSFRLHWSDKERLRQIAERMAEDVARSMPGMSLRDAVAQLTMSSALRALIRDKAESMGIVVDEDDPRQRRKGKPGRKKPGPKPRKHKEGTR